MTAHPRFAPLEGRPAAAPAPEESTTAVIAPDPEMRGYIVSAVSARSRVREHPGVRSALRYDGPVPSVIFYDTHGGLEPPARVVLNFLVRFPTAAVVVLAGHADVHEAVEAVRAGAFGYLLRPFSPDEIEVVWERAAQFHRFLESGVTPGTAAGDAMRRSS